MSTPLDQRILEALSNTRDTSGLRKLLVVLAIRESALMATQERGLADKSLSPKYQVNELPAKRRKDFPPIDPEELPPGFSTSSHFVRLGEIATVSKGKTGIKDALPGPYPLVVTAEGRSSCDHFDFEGPAVIIPTVSSTGHGDASLKRIHFQEGKYAVGSILAAVHSLDESNVSARFLFEYLSAFKDELLVSRMSGTANVSLTATKIEDVPVPLVSKAGQERIAKVVCLCDVLEAKGLLEAAQHVQLVQTLLGALTASTSPEDLADNWQRVATHFDFLLDRPEAIDALEQTILQLAVHGLLVPQDPKDEPASELLKKIRAEKDRLIAEGKIKRDKPSATNTEEEAPFALPLGWERVTIDTLASVGSGTTPSRDNSNFFSDGSIPWVTSGETGRPFIAETAQHVTEAALAQTSLTVYPVGTLIVAMYGQGKTRGQVSELQLEATTNQACAAIVLVEPSPTHRSFVKLVFEKSYEEMRELSAGGAQPNLNVGKIKSTLIPLPPLAEQSRIVARVESLRSLCADLRQRLAARQNTHAHLAEALIDEVA